MPSLDVRCDKDCELAMPEQIRSVKFWINAFIPRDIPGYTRAVPAGPHRGKTMIPGPNPAADCYLTDQRDFSSSLPAKSRMHSLFTLHLTGWPPRFTESHGCDPTTELDCEDGDVECTDTGSNARMRFSLLPGRVTSPSGPFQIEMNCAGNNPCSPSSRLGGDVDYHGRITVAPAASRIDFDLTVDAFPAFEAYASINGRPPTTVFRLPPPQGNTVMNLPGGANRRVRKRLEDRNRDGIPETVTALP